MKRIINNTLKNIKFSKLVIFVTAIIVLLCMFNVKFWKQKNRVICWDVISYYAYLPATFVYDDVTLDFVNKGSLDKEVQFWPIKTPIGKNAIKTSMGMSFLYAPFFFLGHFYALHSHYAANGFTLPYKFALMMSSLFYLLIGLFFLRKVLLKYYSETVTGITLIAIFFGTNLFYYSAYEATLSHVYSFSLIAIFIYLTLKWHKNPSVKNSILIGLLFGLISLVRPSNIIVILIFIFWSTKSLKDIGKRFTFLIKSYQLILIMILSFIIVWIPQFIYWKIVSGSFLYYSYSNNEHFFFNNPQIINGLFSYRKGWLLYTPIMSFALLGIIVLYKKNKEFFLPILIFLLVNVYIIFSWWAWWYGGCYGARALIDSYSILAIPFAAFVDLLIRQKKLLKISGLVLIFTLVLFSVFQTSQYYYGEIHWDSMSKKAYWATFGKLSKPDNFQQLLEHPDYAKAKKGIQAVMPNKK